MSERSAETVLLQLHSLSDPDSETEVHVKSKSRLRGAVSGRNGESIPLMSSCTSGGATASDEDEGRNVFSDREFTVLVRSAMEAIRHGVLPQRISQGSSGSYFVKNIDEENIGVFKPKDEEPYGHLNPKWTKWVHKLCCPCCFGRSCLVPNQGYLSEVGASIVDQKLDLGVVPKTNMVYLSSESFHYRRHDRFRVRLRRLFAETWPDTCCKNLSTDLPIKVGSFQQFVKSYQDAEILLEEFRQTPPPPHIQRQLQLQFEKLVVLDYIIRNTDRGNDNWLVKYIRPTATQQEKSNDMRTLESVDEQGGSITIAAIDNGLAFPFKHPDEWRAYPFYWAWLPLAREPFSEATCYLVLDKLRSQQFVQSLVDELRAVFSTDKGFDNDTFENQMSVLRGQILNLTNALEQRKSPWDLVRMPPITIQAVRVGRTRKFIQGFRRRAPFFQWC